MRQPNELDTLAVRARDDRGALDVLVLAMQGDARAMSVKRSKTHAEDLEQEGMIALLTAVPLYDPARGSFRAYAILHMRKAMSRFSDRQTSVKVASSILHEARILERRLLPQCGPERTREILSERYGTETLQQLLYAEVSLDVDPLHDPSREHTRERADYHPRIENLASDDPGPEALCVAKQEAARAPRISPARQSRKDLGLTLETAALVAGVCIPTLIKYEIRGPSAVSPRLRDVLDRFYAKLRCPGEAA